MGRPPGPAPLPTAIKRARGNPGKRPLPPAEPRPRTVDPKPPRYLSREARRIWRRTVPLLRGMNVLTEVDGDALAQYCLALAEYIECQDFLRENGRTYPTRDRSGHITSIQQWPQVSIARQAQATVLRYQQEFGLTPAARTRIHAEERQADADPEETVALRLLGRP